MWCLLTDEAAKKIVPRVYHNELLAINVMFLDKTVQDIWKVMAFNKEIDVIIYHANDYFQRQELKEMPYVGFDSVSNRLTYL